MTKTHTDAYFYHSIVDFANHMEESHGMDRKKSRSTFRDTLAAIHEELHRQVPEKTPEPCQCGDAACKPVKWFVRANTAWPKQIASYPRNQVEEFNIGLNKSHGRLEGEWTMTWHDLAFGHRLPPRLNVFDDGWDALVETGFMELILPFSWKSGKSTLTPDLLIDILTKAGWVDQTSLYVVERYTCELCNEWIDDEPVQILEMWLHPDCAGDMRQKLNAYFEGKS